MTEELRIENQIKTLLEVVESWGAFVDDEQRSSDLDEGEAIAAIGSVIAKLTPASKKAVLRFLSIRHGATDGVTLDVCMKYMTENVTKLATTARALASLMSKKANDLENETKKP